MLTLELCQTRHWNIGRVTNSGPDAALGRCGRSHCPQLYRAQRSHASKFAEGEGLEVRAGIEPAFEDLQSSASPLCHRTPGA